MTTEAFEKALASGDLAALRKAVQEAHDAVFESKVSELNGLRDDLALLEKMRPVYANDVRQAREAMLAAIDAAKEAQKAADQAAGASGQIANRYAQLRAELAQVRARIQELEDELRAVLQGEQAPVVHSLVHTG